jgi:hypothetical protein
MPVQDTNQYRASQGIDSFVIKKQTILAFVRVRVQREVIQNMSYAIQDFGEYSDVYCPTFLPEGGQFQHSDQISLRKSIGDRARTVYEIGLGNNDSGR